MLSRIGVLCVCLLVPHVAFASSIVTWIGDGAVTFSYQRFPQHVVPPVGTPFSLTMTFDPAAAIGTPNSGGLGTNCMRVDVAASVNLGGYIYSGSNNFGYTNAQLPGTDCSESRLTQFSLHGVQTPEGAPWDLDGEGVLILSYRDFPIQGVFPSVPPGFPADFWYDQQLESWGFRGRVNLRAVDQAAPVPEPGTMTLFGLGLAAVARRIKQLRRS